MENEFIFLDPGKLGDGDLELVLAKKNPADKERGYSPSYEFEMRQLDTGDKMGSIRLRIGNDESIQKYAGHIGYGVDEKHRGHRYAARSVRLLFPLAKKHGLNPLWITCNPENTPSKRSCEIAGGVLVEIVDLPENNEQYQMGERKKCRYRFDL